MPVTVKFGAALFLVAAMLGSACVAGTPDAPERTTSVQAIVRFAPDADVSVAGLDRIAEETGLQLRYLRPLASEAHVLVLSGGEAESPELILERLRRHPDVRQVELDRGLRGL